MSKTKTVLGRTLEEIKDEYAINLAGYNTWDELINDEPSYRVEIHTDQVAERYAKSQTQELQEHNYNLAKNLLEMSNSLVELIKENENLKDLSNTITGLQLQEQNAELVEMIEHIFYKTNFQSHFPTTSIKVKNLLSKYNHLKSNTQE